MEPPPLCGAPGESRDDDGREAAYVPSNLSLLERTVLSRAGQEKEIFPALLYCCRRRGCLLLQRRVWFHATLKAPAQAAQPAHLTLARLATSSPSFPVRSMRLTELREPQESQAAVEVFHVRNNKDSCTIHRTLYKCYRHITNSTVVRTCNWSAETGTLFPRALAETPGLDYRDRSRQALRDRLRYSGDFDTMANVAPLVVSDLPTESITAAIKSMMAVCLFCADCLILRWLYCG